MHLTPEELEIVRDVLRRFVAGYEVWIFGSRATGKRLKKTSDLDLVVITEKELSGAVLMQLKDAFSLSLLPFRVDVLDWAAVSENFRKIILQNYEVIQKRPHLWDDVYANLDALEYQEIHPGFRARFIHSAHHTIAFWKIDKGAVLPEHSHMHEQTSMVTKGEFELTVEGKSQVLAPNKVAVIAPNRRHSGRALTDCEITDIFYPVRQDYMEGTASYA
jgi:quercetin dioxygenase-like cupin family protein/predicted nucleotidyltransferase